MSDEVEALLRTALAEESLGLLLVGEERGARALLRALAGAFERAHAIGFTRDVEGWPELPSLRVVRLDGELTPTVGLRSALRQDPDALLLEAPLDELPLELLCVCAETGHAVLARAGALVDERPLLEALGPLGERAGSVPRIVVVDGRGVARLVETTSGATVWRRGEPLPTRERATGRAPRVPFTPPPRDPVPPLAPDLLERLHGALELRPAWLPVLDAPAGRASTLGGRPRLVPGEGWPACGACGAAMPLAVQLARGELPDEARALFPAGAELLQLFYCSDSSCSASDAAGPAAPNRLLRFLAEGAAPAAVPAAVRAPMDVVAWEPRLETASGEEVELDAELREARWQARDRVDAGEATDDEAALAGPRRGNKLLGWPAWAQGAEHEACPRCGARMRLLFQVDADDGPLGLLFAADGAGHVSQCPTHLDVLAFRWACG